MSDEKKLEQNEALEDLSLAIRRVSETGVPIALSVMYEEGDASLCVQMSNRIVFDGEKLKLK